MKFAYGIRRCRNCNEEKHRSNFPPFGSARHGDWCEDCIANAPDAYSEYLKRGRAFMNQMYGHRPTKKKRSQP